MKYCTHCGKEIKDEAVVCLSCGCAIEYKSVSQSFTMDYIAELSKRVKINGIIWICIACIQIIMALTINWILGIIGILNLISAIRDLNYSKEVLTNQTGIIQRFEPIAGPIIILVYNVVFGGIIGVAGSIYYLVGIRGFVLNNKVNFLKYDLPA